MRIYVDAMGGDRAPSTVLDGVELALKEIPNAEIILLGDKDLLSPRLKRIKLRRPEILHCTDSIQMDESPVQAVRSKKDSTIVRGLRATAEDPHSAFFSAGHSGAVFAAALMELGRLESIERPAIATALPTLTGHCVLLDAGANVDCRPQHLVQFAQMGSVYAQAYLKRERPAVGILSNGEEDSKGTELTRAANLILKEDKTLNYVGYVEGKDIFGGKLDVVVTDGFTGNVVLKSLEGLGKTVSTVIRREFSHSLFSKVGALFALPGLKKVQKKLDYAEVGSAPLLGVDGNCFIGHGSSSPKAIKNGILRAAEAIESGVHEKLREQFGKTQPRSAAT